MLCAVAEHRRYIITRYVRAIPLSEEIGCD